MALLSQVSTSYPRVPRDSFLPSYGVFSLSGYRHLCNEIDLLLFLRDPLTMKAGEPDEANLIRLCDVHSIPVATNIATAEALIHALEKGDLDWRNIVNPKR